MKGINRLLAVVMAVILAIGALSGCGAKSGSSADTNKEDGSSSQDNPQAASGDEEPYQIDIELLLGMPNPDLEEVEAAINEITLEKINCTVKLREISIADHATQMNLLATGSDKIDIINAGYTTSPSRLKDSGLLLGIGDILKENAPNLLEKCGKLMDACYIDGDIYFIPGNLYPASQRIFSYNDALVEQYNIEIPEMQEGENAFDYVERFYENVIASDFDGYGTTAGDGFSVPGVDAYYESFGDTRYCSYGVLMDMTKDTKIVNFFETQEFADACYRAKEWRDKGYMVPDSLTNGSTVVDATASGQIVGSIGAANATYLGNQEKITGIIMEAVPISEMMLTGATIGEYSLAITTTSKNPEKCAQFLDLLYTDAQLSNLVNYGIEGKHYVKESEHIIKLPEGVGYDSLGYGNQISTFGDAALNYQKAPFTEEFYVTLPDYSYDNAVVSSAFGYSFNSEAVKTQNAAVCAVIGEYLPSLCCGIVDVDEKLPEFIAELKDAGIDDIIAENQRQYDEWLAAKN